MLTVLTSSDLWVSNAFAHQTTNLSIPAEVTYAVGSAKGFVSLSDLEFVGFTIPNQAYSESNSFSFVHYSLTRTVQLMLKMRTSA